MKSNNEEKKCGCHCHFNEKKFVHAGNNEGDDICPIQSCFHCQSQNEGKVKTSQEVLMNLEIDKTKKTLSPPLSEPIEQEKELDEFLKERNLHHKDLCCFNDVMAVSALKNIIKSLLLQEQKRCAKIAKNAHENCRMLSCEMCAGAYLAEQKILNQ